MDLKKFTKEVLITKLKNSQSKENFFENVSNMAYFCTDKNRVVLEWNQTCEYLYGYKKEEAIGKTIETLIIPDYQRELFIEEFQNRQATFGEELEYQKSDGTILTTYVNSLFIDQDNTNFQYHHLSVNTSKIKQSNALRELIDKREINLTNKTELIIISFNKNGYINDFNPFAEKLLGYKKEDVIGRNFIELFVPSSYKEKTLKQIQESFRSKNMQVKSDLPLLCKNGTKKIVHWNQTFVYDYKTDTNSILLVGDNNILDRSANDRLEYLANYDSLTDLPNRHLLQNRMRNAINRAARYNKKMITMYINLDIH